MNASLIELQRQAVDRVLEAVSPALAAELDRVISQAAEELAAAEANWAAERTQLEAERDQWRAFAEAPAELSASGSQAEILVRFLRLVAPFADSAAVYVSKADGFTLWKARGPALFPDAIAEGKAGAGLYFRPVGVRDKNVAAVCAFPPYNKEALDFLGECLQRSIELFGLRLRA